MFRSSLHFFYGIIAGILLLHFFFFRCRLEVVLFIRRLQIMIKDVNEQLQSSVKTSDSFFLEIYPMRLSMARIGWEEILLSLSLSPHLSHHTTCQVMRDRKLSICLCYLSKISKPNMCFSWKCLQTWVCFAKKVSDAARRIRNHRNCIVGG